MGAAQKKKQDTGHRTRDTRRSAGPLSEGPRLGLLRIRITQGQFKAIQKSKFVRLRLSSRDGKFLLDMIVRDADSHLELVPKRMRGIMIDMDAKTFEQGVGSKTIVMLEDGIRNKGFKIAAIRAVELMNDGKWTQRKKHYAN